MSTTPAQSVAKTIWRYVAYSFQSDSIPNAEIAFRYAAYTYSILDILEAHELALTVRYLFAETFAALTIAPSRGHTASWQKKLPVLDAPGK